MKRYVSILQIAATYIGTVVGAGFASGLSIMQFFTVYGAYGIAGIGLSTFLFIWLGTKMMVLSHRLRAYSYQELNTFLFGKWFGKAANLVSFFILFGVSAVMLSGTGSIFEEQLGLPGQVGIIVSLILIYAVLTRQLNGIVAINSIVVPMMLLFSVIVGLSSIGADGLWRTNDWQLEQVSSVKWLISPFAYAALNFVTLQAVLVPLGSEVKNERDLMWGGVWGGLGIGAMLIISQLSMNALMPGIMKFSIPMAEVIRELGPWLHLLFIVVVYSEIFTTLIGNVFGMTRQIQSLYPSLRSNRIAVALLLICYAVSQIGYASLLSHLYAWFGYAGLVLLVLLAVRPTPVKPVG